VFQLAQVPLFGFFQDLVDKFAPSQYPLIEIFRLPSPSHAQYLRPPALASDKASARQLFYSPLAGSFPHILAVFVSGFSADSAELGQYAVGIHPGMLCLADDGPVAAPRVSVQFFDGLDNAGPQGIEMDVADKCQKVILFVAEDGFIAVFEQMACPFVAAVVVLCVPGEKSAHDAGYAVLAAPEKQMDVIAHQNPGVDGALSLAYIQTKALKEKASVLIVFEYCCFVDTPHHDMVQGGTSRLGAACIFY
jgi:hypothetical protein